MNAIPTADQDVLADFALFLKDAENRFPGLRDEMCAEAVNNYELTIKLTQLNQAYHKFASARSAQHITDMQLYAASVLEILRDLYEYGVVPYFHSKASRMRGVKFSGFTFIKY